MNVQLKKLRLSHFKGIKSLELEFGPEENFIYGANATGKTTVFDAIWFLFFGKDSEGKAEFGIKTRDENGNHIEKVDHEVYGEFLIDGISHSFQRTYKQKWSKDGVLTGHTTDYEINGLPVRLESEYKKQVEEFFKEETFKLITNPLFFNSLKTTERRNILISLGSNFSPIQILDTLPSKRRKSPFIQDLEKLLTEGARIEQIKLKASRDKKNYQDEKDAIPDRIDEAKRNMPEVYNFEELEEIINEKKVELSSIEKQISEAQDQYRAKNKAVTDHNNKVFEAKTKLQKLEFTAQQEFNKWQNDQNKYPNELRDKINDLQTKGKNLSASIKDMEPFIQRRKANISSLENVVAKQEAERSKLVEDWKEENSKEFIWNGSTCPSCERALEGAQAFDAEEKAKARFNKDKDSILADIVRRGENLKAQISENKASIEQANNEIRSKSKQKEESESELAQINEEITTIESEINEWYATPQEGKEVSDFLSDEAKDLKAKITELENSVPEVDPLDTAKLVEAKDSINSQLEELQKSMGHKETIEKTNKRIDELKAKESELAQAISNAEGLEQACIDFAKAKVEMIETEINSKFSMVRFNLFRNNLQGNEEEVCETMFNGNDYPNLNNAGKIQAGLDIINGLSRHYGLHLPIFIDNRESVTWIPEVESQLINLVVDPLQDKLKLETVSQATTA